MTSYAKALDETVGLSDLSNGDLLRNFALYTPRQDLARFLARYELFRRVLDVPGSIVEGGVFQGGGLLAWAQLSAAFEPVNHPRRVIGFDTFAGFPALSRGDTGARSAEARQGGLAYDGEAEIRRAAALLDMNRPNAQIAKLELVRGDACDTIPAYLRAHPHLLLSLLYLDFDLYEPTLTALEVLTPRMAHGAILAFDDLNLADWPGETLAALPWLRKLRLRRFPWCSTLAWARL